MRLKLAISPCPNDTYMFDALINGRIDTGGMRFEVTFADIEQLNAAVMSGGDGNTPDISKISYAVLPAIASRYRLLDSGSALGHGNGPLLVARPGFKLRSAGGTTEAAGSLRVAVPGIHTTANLLLQRLFPEIIDRRPMLFSGIAEAVASGRFDAGVLIHEGRFTYREHGLEQIADLGTEWAGTTGNLPLPLGAIVASRALPPEITQIVEGLIRQSIEYANSHPEASREFIKQHAREMDNKVIDSHIALFVNENSLTLSPEARRAVTALTGVKVE